MRRAFFAQFDHWRGNGVCRSIQRYFSTRLTEFRRRLQEDGVSGVSINNASGNARQRRVATSERVSEAAKRLQADSTDLFWQRTQSFSSVPLTDFLCPRWQKRNSVSGNEDIEHFLNLELKGGSQLHRNSENISFIEDVLLSLEERPMKVKLTPYILALINWSDPYLDPLRRQFLPVKSELVPDHPVCTFDSLSEKKSLSAAGDDTGIVHRYRDKVLLLANSTCPVYCQYCTRSYAVGPRTKAVGTKHRWVGACALSTSKCC